MLGWARTAKVQQLAVIGVGPRVDPHLLDGDGRQPQREELVDCPCEGSITERDQCQAARYQFEPLRGYSVRS